MADDTDEPPGPSLVDMHPGILNVIGDHLRRLYSTPPALKTTMPPEPVQEVMKGVVEPLTNAGWLLGGYLQGTERPSTLDVMKAAGGLGLAAMPMGPGGEAALARGVARGVGRAGERVGVGGLEEAQRAAATASRGYEPVQGLPQGPFTGAGGEPYVPGPIGDIHEAAANYMKSAGLDYDPLRTYQPVDVDRAKRLAQTFEDLPHAPNDPAVRKSYNAMISETLAQYQALQRNGYKFEFIKPGMEDPYAASPRLAAQDLRDNKHLWVFPTDLGFGSGGKEAQMAMRDNPMMQGSGITIDGKPTLNNDIFRIVHDVYGHFQHGFGFRAAGEENAWRSHSRMYSDLARPAMTAETRGQNSWVNFGPHGDTNRTASAADTVYAPQKINIMPDWAVKEGAADPYVNPVARAREREAQDPLMQEPPPEPSPVFKPQADVTDPFGFAIKGPAFSKKSSAVLGELAGEPKGTGPLDLTSAAGPSTAPQFDLRRYLPPRGVSERLTDALANPNVIQGVKDSIENGKSMGAHLWYHSDPIRQAFVDELGPEEGAKSFDRFIDHVAATSPRSDVPVNIRNASYYYMLDKTGRAPEKPLPYPYGHVAQRLHMQNFGAVTSEGWDPLKNPKPPSYGANLGGNLQPVTADTHAFRNIGMRTGDPRFLETSISEQIPKGREPSNFMKNFGDIRGDKVVYRPQQLVADKRMTMEEAQKIPAFWEAQPKKNEYGAVEQFYKQLAKEHGLQPAEAQSAAWAGAGEMTGLGTPPEKTFPEMFNERVEYTARMRNEDPKKTLKDFIRGRKPLLGLAGGIGAPMALPHEREQ